MKVSEKAKELIGDFSTATEQTALNPTVAAFNLYCATREDLEDYIAELEAQITDLDTEYTKLLRSDYSQTIVELEAKIAELEAAQRWIPEFITWSFDEATKLFLEIQEDKAKMVALQSRIAELEAKQRWIPVSEPPIITHYNDTISAGKVSVDVKRELTDAEITRLENRFADTKSCNGRLVEQVEQLTAENKRLKAVLNEWDMAWLTDCIAPQPNGNEAFGLDEGLVLCARMMKPILEETRLLLGKAEVVR